MKPFISAKCITYARVDLLEEALYSFLNQEYDGQKEMVIVNDYPLQTLHFNHPEVTVINTDTTFRSIGEKENYAVSLCKGSHIAVWDDDDVALSNHLDNISKYMGDNDLLHWHRGVYYNEPSITAITGLGNSGIVYTKAIWEKVGKHPLENAGYDTTFVNSIHRVGKVVSAAPPDNEVSWFYMWGGRAYHMSGLGADRGQHPNVLVRHATHIEEMRRKGLVPTGNIYLKPKWKHDYKEMLTDYVQSTDPIS